nr:hypothetical protein CFP56_13388 [Quercus suber]
MTAECADSGADHALRHGEVKSQRCKTQCRPCHPFAREHVGHRSREYILRYWYRGHGEVFLAACRASAEMQNPTEVDRNPIELCRTHITESPEVDWTVHATRSADDEPSSKQRSFQAVIVGVALESASAPSSQRQSLLSRLVPAQVVCK